MFEVLVGKEKLLARREHKFGGAEGTFQDSVGELHFWIPNRYERDLNRMQETAALVAVHQIAP
jgi:hypothetical protein